jgi:hypothetical protein
VENSKGSIHEEDHWPFLEESDNPKKWQQVYRDAVVIALALQRHGFDPQEAQSIRSDQVHMIFMAEKIFTFNEQVVFDVAIQLLRERHKWSYGNQ